LSQFLSYVSNCQFAPAPAPPYSIGTNTIHISYRHTFAAVRLLPSNT